MSSTDTNLNAFQHTAARRRLAGVGKNTAQILLFQHTAARRRLVTVLRNKKSSNNVSTHSRPKAAGKLLDARHASPFVSTHSRPKAAGCMKLSVMARRCRFQHTAARRRLGTYSHGTHPHQEFQHTAARRRLGCQTVVKVLSSHVSTHSRPKAAGQQVLV